MKGALLGGHQLTVIFADEILADYHQFYLADASGDFELPENWTAIALSQRVLAAAQALVFSTARNMKVPVRVELHEKPVAVPHDCDHAVAASLSTGGQLVVAGLSDYLPDAPRLSVPPGFLRVLVASFGLATLSADGMNGEDRYDVYLWPAPFSQMEVSRQWTEAAG
jgi:hypothetical protein